MVRSFLVLIIFLIAASGSASTDYLLSPNHKQVVLDENPTFRWKPFNKATKYIVIVKNKAGATILKQTVGSSACSSTECSMRSNTAFSTKGTYRWFVRAKNATSRGTSESRTFKFISGYEEQLQYLINQKRCAAGLAPLALNAELNRAAMRHSEDMFTNNFFSHTGSDGSSFVQRISRAGYKGSAVGENIAKGYPNTESVFNGWWNSPGHKANIMNSGAREFGIGYKSPYWTMVTGKAGTTILGKCP
jgi:uncharacterized protein YkwD